MASLLRFVENLDGRQRLFALVFILALVALLSTLYIKGMADALLVGAFILAIFWLVGPRIWQPEDYGRYRIARYSLWIILAVATASPLWLDYLLPIIWPYLQDQFPQLPPDPPSTTVTTMLTFVFVLGGVAIVNALLRSAPSVAGTPSTHKRWARADTEWYLAHMRTLYATTRILGKTTPVSLEDIYTDVYMLDELTARQRFGIEELRQSVQKHFDSFMGRERRDGMELVRQSNNLFILGKPGAGKTTFLRYIALQAAQGKFNRLPFFVTLKEWKPEHGSLMPLILKHFNPHASPHAAPFVEEQLRRGKAILLFDGLDEVNQEQDLRKQVTEQLTDISERYPQCQCLITCRIAASDYQFPRFQEVEVADFTDEQMRIYVANWFDEDKAKEEAFFTEFEKSEHQGLRELAAIPLLLSLLCLVFDESMAFPLRRGELYKRALHVLLEKWDSVRIIRRDTIYRGLTTDLKQQMFAAIAAKTFDLGEYFFPLEFLKREIEAWLARLPATDRRCEVDGRQIVQEIEAQHSILVERAQGIYSFSHLTLHEYFAAKYVVDHEARGTVKKLVTREHVTEDRWKEVLVLTASLLPSADDFFEQFHQVVVSIIHDDERLITILDWAATKVSSMATSHERSALRALYLHLDYIYIPACNNELALDLARRLDHELFQYIDQDFDQDFDQDLALALDQDIDQYIDLANIHGGAFASALDLALARDRDLALALDLALTLALASALDRKSVLPSDFALTRDRALALARELKLDNLQTALESLPRPSGDEPLDFWEDYTARLRTIMITHRNIGHEWNLSQEQRDHFDRYFQANQLLVEYLNVAVVSDRQAITERLLLPPQKEPDADS